MTLLIMLIISDELIVLSGRGNTKTHLASNVGRPPGYLLSLLKY